MPLTQVEAVQVSELILEDFEQVLDEYSFEKYPAESYEEFKAIYSSLQENNNLIESSLKWKWGHWGKDNYPQAQQNLAAEIQREWPRYVASVKNPTAEQTFLWWKHTLNRNTTYITTAYITHLVHNTDPLPIIDQHNYRAINHLKSLVRSNHSSKKKPSTWNDIVLLKQFMQIVLPLLPGRNFGEFDRFLMMYGRNHVPN